MLEGEKVELRLRPSWSSAWPQRAWALVLMTPAGALWVAFHASWWTGHRPSDWTAFWTWAWGNDAAAAIWSIGALALVGGLVGMRWRRFRLGAAGGLLVGLAAALAAFLLPLPIGTALPASVAAAGLTTLVLVEARRLATTYLVTSHRIVERRPRVERSVLYTDLVDLDVRRGVGDAGTLVPILRDEAPKPVLVGVRRLERVRRLIEALARRATASDRMRSDPALEAELTEAMAALQKP